MVVHLVSFEVLWVDIISCGHVDVFFFSMVSPHQITKRVSSSAASEVYQRQHEKGMSYLFLLDFVTVSP